MLAILVGGRNMEWTMNFDELACPTGGPVSICAIVAGAANGAGANFARALAERGAQLVLVDRDEIALMRLGEELDCLALYSDVLCDDGVGGMFDLAEDRFGHIDMLINAAGTGYVRTLGVMRASREFARRPRGRKAFIVNVAARPDREDGPFSYAGSEVAFNRLADGLAKSIEGPRLRVLTLERADTPEAVADLVEQLCRLIAVPDSDQDARIAGC